MPLLKSSENGRTSWVALRNAAAASRDELLSPTNIVGASPSRAVAELMLALDHLALLERCIRKASLVCWLAKNPVDANDPVVRGGVRELVTELREGLWDARCSCGPLLAGVIIIEPNARGRFDVLIGDERCDPSDWPETENAVRRLLTSAERVEGVSQ